MMKAFPYEESYNHNGMDLRDYFAAKAMPMLLQIFRDDLIKDGESFDYIEIEFNIIAEWAYKQADAMMKARNADPVA